MKINEIVWPDDQIEHKTDSIEELASFWDSHDLTDFDDQLEEVTEVIFERQKETFSIPFFPREIETVKNIAKSDMVQNRIIYLYNSTQKYNNRF